MDSLYLILTIISSSLLIISELLALSKTIKCNGLIEGIINSECFEKNKSTPQISARPIQP